MSLLVSFDANTPGGREKNQNCLSFRGLGISAKRRPRAAKPLDRSDGG